MMSQAKTQMVNKSFVLTGNTSNLDDNTWSSDGLGHFGTSSMSNPIGLRSNNNNNDSVNWSNSQASTAAKLISSNSSNSSNGGDLWSNDMSHNNFNHNLDEILANEKVNKTFLNFISYSRLIKSVHSIFLSKQTNGTHRQITLITPASATLIIRTITTTNKTNSSSRSSNK